MIRRLYPFATDVAFEKVKVASLVELGRHFRVRAAIDSCLIRLGSPNDGGYLLVDNFKNSDVLLSLGIGDNNTFDIEIANRISEVHMYDHTIDEIPESFQNGFFHKLGISDLPSQNFTTIPQVVTEFPAAQEFILKIDIEGDEWKVLDGLDVNLLSRFRQITGEFHGFHQLINQADELKMVIRVMSKLVSNHKFVNLHANNWARVDVVKGMLVPDVIEFTLAREDLLAGVTNSSMGRVSLNRPNNPDASEIYLGLFSHL